MVQFSDEENRLMVAAYEQCIRNGDWCFSLDQISPAALGSDIRDIEVAARHLSSEGYLNFDGGLHYEMPRTGQIYAEENGAVRPKTRKELMTEELLLAFYETKPDPTTGVVNFKKVAERIGVSELEASPCWMELGYGYIKLINTEFARRTPRGEERVAKIKAEREKKNMAAPIRLSHEEQMYLMAAFHMKGDRPFNIYEVAVAAKLGSNDEMFRILGRLIAFKLATAKADDLAQLTPEGANLAKLFTEKADEAEEEQRRVNVALNPKGAFSEREKKLSKPVTADDLLKHENIEVFGHADIVTKRGLEQTKGTIAQAVDGNPPPKWDGKPSSVFKMLHWTATVYFPNYLAIGLAGVAIVVFIITGILKDWRVASFGMTGAILGMVALLVLQDLAKAKTTSKVRRAAADIFVIVMVVAFVVGIFFAFTVTVADWPPALHRKVFPNSPTP